MRLKPSVFQVFIQGSRTSADCSRDTPSSIAARRHASGCSCGAAERAAVARLNRSSPATIAAVISGEAAGAISFEWERRGATGARIPQRSEGYVAVLAPGQIDTFVFLHFQSG